MKRNPIKSNPQKRPSAATKAKAETRYRRGVERAQKHIMENSRLARDIAPAPPVKDRERLGRCRESLEFFLADCFPNTFFLQPFNADQREMIGDIEAAIRSAGNRGFAATRGGGKSSIARRAILWAVLNGYRRFGAIFADTNKLAAIAMKTIKSELLHNDNLLAIYPKAIYPIRKIEGQSRRCVGQLYDGKMTEIVWLPDEVVLPTMPPPDNSSSGSIIICASMESGVRGINYTDTKGNTIRPDLFLIDDPQSRESAQSFIQNEKRLQIIDGDILPMAGASGGSTAILLGTVITEGDAMDVLLDRKRSPSWNGKKFKTIYAYPVNMEFWDEYGRLFLGGHREEATEYYRQHRDKMDQGAKVAWESRHDPTEISGLQNAMNIKISKPDIFDAEYQNEPRRAVANNLDATVLVNRLNGYDRCVLPPGTEKITCFVDLGATVFWWGVVAWGDDMTGWLIDYGTFPQQPTRISSKASASPTIFDVTGQSEEKAAVYRALQMLEAQLLPRQFSRGDGASLGIEAVGVDVGWNTQTVRSFIRASNRRPQWQITMGRGIGAAQARISQYPRRQGERIGDEWILGKPGSDGLRLLKFDASYWKSELAKMLAIPMGMRSGLSFYGGNAGEHHMLAHHLTAERCHQESSGGRTSDHWIVVPARDNDLMDVLGGCCLLASLRGLTPLRPLSPVEVPKPQRRGPIVVEI